MPERRLQASGMLLWGPQTPINTEQNRNSNRFRKRTIHNRQKRRRDQANFNEFLGKEKDVSRAVGLGCSTTIVIAILIGIAVVVVGNAENPVVGTAWAPVILFAVIGGSIAFALLKFYLRPFKTKRTTSALRKEGRRLRDQGNELRQEAEHKNAEAQQAMHVFKAENEAVESTLRQRIEQLLYRLPANGVASSLTLPSPRRALSSGSLRPSHVFASPISGVFCDAPTPGVDPFVRIGNHVLKGQVLCIVEAMGLRNEIESDVEGEVLRVLAKPGDPVEYGQALFELR